MNNVQHPMKCNRQAKKQDNTTYNEEKNYPIEAEPAMTKMILLLHKNMKTVVKLEQSINEGGTMSSGITYM